MTGVFDIAAAQIAVQPGATEDNLGRFALRVREHADGCRLIVGPEMLAAGYDLARIDQHGAELAEDLDGPTVSVATELAAEIGATIVVGVLERSGEALYDSVAVVRERGLVSTYRKTHLYPPERSHFAPGDRLVTVPTPAGRIGVMICFEHAFPEIATALALAGAQILAIPSAVPKGHEHHLSLRTRARAQDNQLFAIAPNLAGGEFFGGSMIVDPTGEILARAGEGEEVLRARIDLGAIDRERQREPALGLRRPELYEAPPTPYLPR